MILGEAVVCREVVKNQGLQKAIRSKMQQKCDRGKKKEKCEYFCKLLPLFVSVVVADQSKVLVHCMAAFGMALVNQSLFI